MKYLVFLNSMLACIVLTGCQRGDAGPTAEVDAPVPVQVAFPERADLDARYAATATLESDLDAPAIARVGGEVVQIVAEEGDVVREGDVLARLDGERLRLEMLAARADLDKARSEYARYEDLHQRGLVSASMYDGLQYELEALQAVYNRAALEYGYSEIRAPIAGIVSSRDIKPGQMIEPSAVAFRITDVHELVAYLQIPQTELDRIAAGQDATLRVDALPGRDFDAEIIRISPTIDVRNGTFRATATVDNAARLLAPGMFARFSVLYEQHENAITVPATAVVVEDQQSMVYVVSNESVSRRPVTTGLVYDGRIEIVSGLEGDEAVVVVGHAAIRDGSRVLARTAAETLFAG